jgi:hypothetical protein
VIMSYPFLAYVRSSARFKLGYYCLSLSWFRQWGISHEVANDNTHLHKQKWIVSGSCN